jgi:hypothetical protein
MYISFVACRGRRRPDGCRPGAPVPPHYGHGTGRPGGISADRAPENVFAARAKKFDLLGVLPTR